MRRKRAPQIVPRPTEPTPLRSASYVTKLPTAAALRMLLATTLTMAGASACHRGPEPIADDRTERVAPRAMTTSTTAPEAPTTTQAIGGSAQIDERMPQQRTFGAPTKPHKIKLKTFAPTPVPSYVPPPRVSYPLAGDVAAVVVSHPDGAGRSPV